LEVLYFTTQPVGRPVVGFRDGEEVEDYSTEKTAERVELHFSLDVVSRYVKKKVSVELVGVP
jgi:hypothetical protein